MFPVASCLDQRPVQCVSMSRESAQIPIAEHSHFTCKQKLGNNV